MTDGRCTLCGETYTKQGMTRHLRSCTQDHVDAGDRPTFHLSIGDAYRTDYWMHVEIEQETTLAALDEFLRDIWLDCCGHMSSFTIDDVEYVKPYTEEESMLGFGVERLQSVESHDMLVDCRRLNRCDSTGVVRSIVRQCRWYTVTTTRISPCRVRARSRRRGSPRRRSRGRARRSGRRRRPRRARAGPTVPAPGRRTSARPP